MLNRRRSDDSLTADQVLAKRERAEQAAHAAAIETHAQYLERLQASAETMERFFGERYRYRAAMECEALMVRLGVGK